jgi:uncharacterized protein (DUF2235 family)
MKNIVVCCDGTGNSFARDMTNALRLYYVLEKHTARQIALYRPGIGTSGAPGTITPIGRAVTKLLGAALGFGIDLYVWDAYSYLMRHFEPGDRVFLFGFSRGAFAVRAVATLLHTFGLLNSSGDGQNAQG